MKNNRSTPRLQKRKRKPSDFVSEKQKRDAWAKTLGRCEAIAMKVSGKACAVFLALESQADMDGYCWPLIVTLQKLTGIKTRRTISRAFREFERLGILDRAKLISKQKGNRAPRLHRIGGPIERLPSEAAARFILPAPHAIDGEKREAT